MGLLQDKKKTAEKDINEVISRFSEETGLKVNYVDFKKEKTVGFKEEKNKSEIIIENG